MKIFYQNYITDKGINGNNPIRLNLQQTSGIFENLQLEEDNFFGLVDDYKKCISIIKQSYLKNKIIDLGD